MSSLMEEIDAVQADLARMEGMLSALAAGAYHEAKPEQLGNSLEILGEYLGQRAERLAMIHAHFGVMHQDTDAAMGGVCDAQCAFWEKYMEGDGKEGLRSREVAVACGKISRHLKGLPEESRESLVRLAEELETASRKQGFVEGMLEAAGMVFGKEGDYGKQ
jgi:hypothetical protein